jgi:hypothetical protein
VCGVLRVTDELRRWGGLHHHTGVLSTAVTPIFSGEADLVRDDDHRYSGALLEIEEQAFETFSVGRGQSSNTPADPFWPDLRGRC